MVSSRTFQPLGSKGNLVILHLDLLTSMMGTLYYTAANLFPPALHQRSNFLSSSYESASAPRGLCGQKVPSNTNAEFSCSDLKTQFLASPRGNDRHS